jgi:hypothetical protein
MNSAMKYAMVSQGDCIHAEFLCPVYKFRNAAHGIKKAVFCVDMEMGEFHNAYYNNGCRVYKAGFDRLNQTAYAE